jgi:Ca2+-binding EF-hand superfamily protein
MKRAVMAGALALCAGGWVNADEPQGTGATVATVVAPASAPQPSDPAASPPAPAKPVPPGPPAFPSPPTAEELFRRYDRNGDGKITKEDVGERAALLERNDLDGDGAVTLAEFEGAREKMRKIATMPPPAFDDFDADKDGFLKGEEVKKYIFARVDADRDGVIRKFEGYRLGPPPRPIGGAAPGKSPFEELDADRDGKVEFSEFQLTPGLLKRLDRNGDGALSREEVGGGPLLAGPRMTGNPQADTDDFFARTDANHDGTIDAAEFKGRPEVLARFDRNKDGVVTRGEMVEALERMKAGPLGDLVDRLIQRFDANQDGKVERAEFPGQDAAFRKNDRNGDGVISAEDKVGFQAVPNKEGASPPPSPPAPAEPPAAAPAGDGNGK